MKWFIKALRHFADFSGRARRKEYWMFVLFNNIFALVWIVLLTILFALIKDYQSNYEIIIASNVAILIYSLIMMLPSASVVVRRLHDLGKSGWMILIGLIPFVGGVWLFVLMLMEGQKGENEYGPDSKTSPDVFDEQAKLRGSGISMITVSSILILVSIAQIIVFITNYVSFDFYYYLELIIKILILITGVFLIQEKSLYAMPEKGKKTIILLLISSVTNILLVVYSMINNRMNIEWYTFVNILIILTSYCLFTSLVLLLLLHQNKELIRSVAILTIIFFGIYLLIKVFNGMSISNIIGPEWVVIINLLNMAYILLPIIYIVFASVFLSKKTLDSYVDKQKMT